MSNKDICLGVLALQGGFFKHSEMLLKLGCSSVMVREPDQLAGTDGLIIPGGESTTIGMLMERFGLMDVLRNKISSGFPVFGTCAGAILLSDRISRSDQIRIGGISMESERNAYGRQIESFEADLELAGIDQPDRAFKGVFIRAPKFSGVSPELEILGRYENSPVLVRAGSILAASFHPELTDDTRLHKLFIQIVQENL
ncbi:pyridoxal 5'-phosphate synthase glutaminase subunit PdxT [Spirochaeta dissipatitropha]